MPGAEKSARQNTLSGADVNGFASTLLKLGPGRLFAALGLIAVVAAGLFALMFRVGGEEKALLFSDVEMSEVGEMTSRLEQAGIEHELRGEGTAIYVPRSKVLSARLMLAEDSLPSRGSIGYEIFDRQDALGATQFQQNINRLRALEGELARTIAAIDGVQRARVHLVMPERRLFERDATRPSASIVISLVRDPLTQGQVRAVRNLVASAVPGLSAARVTIADETGRLLASAEDDGSAAAAEALDERKTALESRLQQKVQSIVESIVGPGSMRVEINADIDFNRITQTSQTFDPEGRVVRESITREDSARSSEGNDAGATTAARNVPDGAQSGDANSSAGSENSGTEEELRYEISNTTKTEVMEGGRVKRLSVAVAVDGTLTPGENGAPPTWAPRDPQELERITAAVKNAVGFDESRGDRVEVVNLRFARDAVAGTVAEKPALFDLGKNDVMRGAEILAILISALALVFFVLRPLVSGMVRGGSAAPGALATGASAGAQFGHPPVGLPMPGASSETGHSLDPQLEVARIQGQVKASSVKRVADVIEEHPEESLQVIRGWLGGRA